jgi:hypothetical protein
LWAEGQRQTAFEFLKKFTAALPTTSSTMSSSTSSSSVGTLPQPIHPSPASTPLLARCWSFFVSLSLSLKIQTQTHYSRSHSLVSLPFRIVTSFIIRSKLGEWQSALNEGHFDNQNVPQILDALKKAIEFAPNWYKAWHAFAQMNFELGEFAFQIPPFIIIVTRHLLQS